MKNKISSNDQQESKELISLELNPDNIIEIELHPALHKIKKGHLQYINAQIQQLGEGKKMAVYISFTGFVMLDREAKKYRQSDEYARYRLASAFLIDSFSKAVLYNFYLESYNSPVPVNSFSEKHKALRWLKSFL